VGSAGHGGPNSEESDQEKIPTIGHFEVAFI
jgi:hypothetical protein